MSMRGGSRGWGAATMVVLVGMGLLFLAFVMDEGRLVDNPMPVFALLSGAGIFAALFFGPVGKALGKMLEGDSRPDEDQMMRLEDVEARLAELSLEQQRVAELEDRLDFTERLLSQQGAPDVRRLPERP